MSVDIALFIHQRAVSNIPAGNTVPQIQQQANLRRGNEQSIYITTVINVREIGYY